MSMRVLTTAVTVPMLMIAAAVASASAPTTHDLLYLGQLLMCWVMHIDHLASKVKRLASQRMVEVHHYDVVLHLLHGAHHMLAFSIHHG